MWAVWNIFFLIGSLPLNLVYIGIFFTVQLAFTLVAASYFAAADGHPDGSVALAKAGGVFAFLAGLLGYYTVGNLMCQDALSFRFPMGDTSKYFGGNNNNALEKAKYDFAVINFGKAVKGGLRSSRLRRGSGHLQRRLFRLGTRQKSIFWTQKKHALRLPTKCVRSESGCDEVEEDNCGSVQTAQTTFH